jgi:hypothetical protein
VEWLMLEIGPWRHVGADRASGAPPPVAIDHGPLPAPGGRGGAGRSARRETVGGVTSRG